MTITNDFNMLEKIQAEIEKFDNNIISCLTTTSTALSKEIEKAKKGVNDAQHVSDMWNEALKKRAERKDSIYKEIKSSIIPCFLEKKTTMFHSCLVCLRKTEACALEKIQNVAMAKIKEKLIKQQFDMINNELKDARKNFSQLENEKKVCKEIQANQEGIKKIFDKIDIIRDYKDKDFAIDKDFATFATFFQEVEKNNKWEKLNKSYLQEEVGKFKQELEIFYKAKKRMDSDLDKKFSAQIIERCSVLRTHDQQGLSFLNKVVGKKMAYEKERDAYKKIISTAENSYKKAMENFVKISKSPELTCLERHCVKTYSCDDIKKGGCDALDREASCYSSWRDVNKAKIYCQKIKFDKDRDFTDDADSNRYYTDANLNRYYAELNNNEQSYNEQCQDHLDKWEASIPESIWNSMLQYEESLYVITKMKSTIQEKEAEIVEAIKEWTASMYDILQKKEEHNRYFIQHAQFVMEEQVSYAEKNKNERMKICLRGEANTFIDQHLYLVVPEMLNTRSLSLDPYDVINTNNSSPCQFDSDESSFLFNDLFDIPAAERAKSSMSICHFTPPCIHYCFAKSDPSSCDGINKCDNVPCCPQPPCVPAAAQPTNNQPSAQ